MTGTGGSGGLGVSKMAVEACVSCRPMLPPPACRPGRSTVLHTARTATLLLLLLPLPAHASSRRSV